MADYCGVLDYCGIIGELFGLVMQEANKHAYMLRLVLIVGSFVPCLYYGFYCDTTLQALYVAGIILGGIGELSDVIRSQLY